MYQIFGKDEYASKVAKITEEEGEMAEGIIWKENIRKNDILKRNKERKEEIEREYKKIDYELKTRFGFWLVLLFFVSVIVFVLWLFLPFFKSPVSAVSFFFFLCFIILFSFFRLKRQCQKKVKWFEVKRHADEVDCESEKQKELNQQFPNEQDYRAFYDPDTYNLMAFFYRNVLYVNPNCWYYQIDAEESFIYLVFRKKMIEKVAVTEESMRELVSKGENVWLPVHCKESVVNRLADLWLF